MSVRMYLVFRSMFLSCGLSYKPPHTLLQMPQLHISNSDLEFAGKHRSLCTALWKGSKGPSPLG